MKFTKKQLIIFTILALIAGIVIYYLFFKKKKVKEQSYVGPQDCAENCNLPYDNHILLCHKQFGIGNELSSCIANAERMKQDCLGKCDKSLPVTLDLSEVINLPLPADEKLELPSLFQIKYKISTDGKKSVFPMIIKKYTPEVIELPNRRSLLNKNDKYKFIDVATGDKIKIVSLHNISYTVDHKAFNDDFLVTDNDYLISFSQAKENFIIAK
jgi:hypothetical protein